MIERGERRVEEPDVRPSASALRAQILDAVDGGGRATAKMASRKNAENALSRMTECAADGEVRRAGAATRRCTVRSTRTAGVTSRGRRAAPPTHAPVALRGPTAGVGKSAGATAGGSSPPQGQPPDHVDGAHHWASHPVRACFDGRDASRMRSRTRGRAAACCNSGVVQREGEPRRACRRWARTRRADERERARGRVGHRGRRTRRASPGSRARSTAAPRAARSGFARAEWRCRRRCRWNSSASRASSTRAGTRDRLRPAVACVRRSPADAIPGRCR